MGDTDILEKSSAEPSGGTDSKQDLDKFSIREALARQGEFMRYLGASGVDDEGVQSALRRAELAEVEYAHARAELAHAEKNREIEAFLKLGEEPEEAKNLALAAVFAKFVIDDRLILNREECEMLSEDAKGAIHRAFGVVRRNA